MCNSVVCRPTLFKSSNRYYRNGRIVVRENRATSEEWHVFRASHDRGSQFTQRGSAANNVLQLRIAGRKRFFLYILCNLFIVFANRFSILVFYIFLAISLQIYKKIGQMRSSIFLCEFARENVVVFLRGIRCKW